MNFTTVYMMQPHTTDTCCCLKQLPHQLTGLWKQKLEGRQKRDKVGVNNFATVLEIIVLVKLLSKLNSMWKYIRTINTYLYRKAKNKACQFYFSL